MTFVAHHHQQMNPTTVPIGVIIVKHALNGPAPVLSYMQNFECMLHNDNANWNTGFD